jgi:hypothetical protein
MELVFHPVVIVKFVTISEDVNLLVEIGLINLIHVRFVKMDHVHLKSVKIVNSVMMESV